MKPKISLGGKNNHGRMSGVRSSRASSTIFKKLQKLDREISKLRTQLNLYSFTPYFEFTKHTDKKITDRIEKLDLKRKAVRFERKKYNL